MNPVKAIRWWLHASEGGRRIPRHSVTTFSYAAKAGKEEEGNSKNFEEIVFGFKG